MKHAGLILFSMFLSLGGGHLAFAGAYDDLVNMSGGASVNVPPVPSPSREDDGSGGNYEGGGNSTEAPAHHFLWFKPAETQEQRQARAFGFNEQGLQKFRNQNWKEAARFFRRALNLSPNDPVMRQNLKNAEENLARERKTQKRLKSIQASDRRLQKELERRKRRAELDAKREAGREAKRQAASENSANRRGAWLYPKDS